MLGSGLTNASSALDLKLVVVQPGRSLSFHRRSLFVNHRGIIALLAAGFVLAGCDQGSAPTASLRIPDSASELQASTPVGGTLFADRAKRCPGGYVRVRSCSVKFTSKHIGPDTVAVRYTEVKDGTLAESDTCGGSSGVALLRRGNDLRKISGVVSPAFGEAWFVYAGAQTGSCVATFKYSNENGKKLGQAKLKIVNTI
jgi:hypothetical protein